MVHGKKIRFVFETYGLATKILEQLTGFTNRSYLIQQDIPKRNQETHLADHSLQKQEENGRLYVLKFCEVGDEMLHRRHLECRQKTMTHLRKAGFRCPVLVPTARGELCTTYKSPEGDYCVHLLTFLNGQTVLDSLPLDDATFYELGCLLGTLRTHLKQLHLPDLDSNEKSNWSLNNVAKLKEHLHLIEDSDDRNAIEMAMDHFEVIVQPNMHSVETGLLHGDLHDDNLIMMDKPDMGNTTPAHDQSEVHRSLHSETPASVTDDTSPESTSGCQDSKNVTRHHISKFGLIDFEDMMHGCCIYDFAICLASIMVAVDSKTRTNHSPGSPECTEANISVTSQGAVPYYLHVGGVLVAGYLSQHCISDTEKDILYGMVCSRYVQEILLGREASSESDTHNMEYLRWFEIHGMHQLKQLLQLGPESVRGIWGHICTKYGVKL